MIYNHIIISTALLAFYWGTRLASYAYFVRFFWRLPRRHPFLSDPASWGELVSRLVATSASLIQVDAEAT